MNSLSTKYMGLSLKNPIIVGSSPLTATLDNLRKCEDAGAGAVVIKSIFQEQIESDASASIAEIQDYLTHADAYGFLEGASKDHYIDAYLALVEDAKRILDIPVIASINCKDAGTWVDYGQRFVACGADALELNQYVVAADANVSGAEIEQGYVRLVKAARKEFRLPLSLKIGSKFSSLANMIRQFDRLGLDALVLFNRFYNPDIDIDTLKFKPATVVSASDEYVESLRWTALMSAELSCDICASTGIHTGETLVKQLLAGAKAVQVCSTVLKHGFPRISEMLSELERWMDAHEYSSIAQFNGILAQERMDDPSGWERSQYMKSLAGVREER
ncbi:MAG: dihydroorotate dehydrogenase-like protein [Sphaerochaetaceae bacterium]|jgi:dihydroorotate dehydrogenase (fumarate)